MRVVVLVLCSLISVSACSAEPGGYPHPVKSFTFESQRQELRMAYMDVKPEGESRGTFVLLHGKNFNGAYWHQTIDFLVEEYGASRVYLEALSPAPPAEPDQLGQQPGWSSKVRQSADQLSQALQRSEKTPARSARRRRPSPTYQ